MGCCCSNEAEESVQDGEANERTHLLQDPTSISYGNSRSNEYGNHYSSSVSLKGDEHSALHKVLQKTANKVIDVGALDCQTLEEHEYTERARNYAKSINKLSIPQNLLKRKKSMLIADVPGVEKVLSGQLISQGDLTFMNVSLFKLSAALNSIHVVHKEDLVVPFGNA